MVPVPEPEKIDPVKKYRSQYRKIWSRKKVPVLVPEKIGPEKNYRCRYRKKFWVMSHSGMVWMGWNALLLEVILVQGGYNGELGQL